MYFINWNKSVITESADGFTRIRISQIPKFLHTSALYANFVDADTNDDENNDDKSDDADEDTDTVKRLSLRNKTKNRTKSKESDEDLIPIPTACMKMDLKLQSLSDLRHLLSTLRFWSSTDIPDELFAYVATVATSGKTGLPAALAEYATELSYLESLIEVALCETLERKLRVAASCGDLSMLQHLHKKFQSEREQQAPLVAPLSGEFCTAASERGHLHCLKYLHEQGYPIECKALWKAVENDHHECAYYVLVHGGRGMLVYEFFIGKRRVQLSAALAHYGYLDCLQYLLSEQPAMIMANACADAAAEMGRFDVLKFLYENDCDWSSTTTMLAASNGHIDCLRFAHEHGCSWDSSCCAAAARGGHLECLRYAHESGCSWTCETMDAAVSHRDCLVYCRDNGCPWSPRKLENAVRRGLLEKVTFLHEEGGCPLPQDIACIAAAQGHFEVLRYLHERGAQLKRQCCSKAAAAGHFECLRYLLECQCPSDDMVTAYAARNGHLDCLQLARQYGCTWDAECCTWAAGNGHLHCIQWASQNGCPWNEWTTRAAALAGQLEVLQYLHREGCPWNRWTTAAACEANHSACLQYAIDNGCAFDKDALNAYRQSEQNTALQRRRRWFRWPFAGCVA